MKKLLLAALAASVGAVTADAQLTPGDRVEAQIYAGHYWDYYDTGTVSADAVAFRRLDANGPNIDPLAGSLELIGAMAAAAYGPGVDPEILLHTDPVFQEAVRTHSTTGTAVIPTWSPLAAAAPLGVLEADADLTSDPYEQDGDLHVPAAVPVSRLNGDDGGGGDDGGELGPAGRDQGGGDATPGPNVRPFIEELDVLLEDSHLPELSGRGLYVPDPTIPGTDKPDITTGGLDCEDFAEMFNGFAGNQHPGMSTSYVTVEYTTRDGKKVVHAMSVVEEGGGYYIIDPQTGLKEGPYPSQEAAKAGVSRILEQRYNADPSKSGENTYDFGEKYPDPSKPWHEVPAMIIIMWTVLEEYDTDPNDYRPPGGKVGTGMGTGGDPPTP